MTISIKTIFLLFIFTLSLTNNLKMFADESIQENIDFSNILFDSDMYNEKFIESLFKNSQQKVILLKDWFYPKEGEGNDSLTIPLYWTCQYDEMKVHVLYEFEYRIFWINVKDNTKFINDLQKITMSLCKILNGIAIDETSIKKYPNGFFSAMCISNNQDDDKINSKIVIWNDNNWIFITQRRIARGITPHSFFFEGKLRHPGRVGLATIQDDEERTEKNAQWLNFIPETTRKTFTEDQLNACVWPTPKAGTEYSVSPEEMMIIRPQFIKIFKEKNERKEKHKKLDR